MYYHHRRHHRHYCYHYYHETFLSCEGYNKPLLMTGAKGNSKFCLRVEGKENLLFPVGPVIKFFFHTSQLKNRTNYKRVSSFNTSLLQNDMQICHGFKVHDLYSHASQQFKLLFP